MSHFDNVIRGVLRNICYLHSSSVLILLGECKNRRSVVLHDTACAKCQPCCIIVNFVPTGSTALYADDRLSLNTNKRCVVHFGTRQNVGLEFVAHDVLIENTTCIKYLGVYIDKSLKFKEHIRYVVRKISPLVGMLVKMRDVISENQLPVFYNTSIKPIMQYGILVYGCTSRLNLKSIWIL